MLEEQLQAQGREVLRLLLQDHQDLRAARERRREQVTGPDGIARTRAGAGHSRPLSSVFGQVTVSRVAYQSPGAPNVHSAEPGPRPRPPAPRARNKWVIASVAAAVVASVFTEADRRDPDRRRTWIALADGNVHQLDRIRAEAAARNIGITIICDFIHVTGYV